jgi:hypothetical protein
MPITTYLYGRFGNQLFQIANAMAHAFRHGMPFQIPDHTSQPGNYQPGPWPVYITHLPVLTIPFGDFGCYREAENHRYVEVPRKEQICFDGYWQSYKYFWDQRHKVFPFLLQAFEFTRNLPNINFTGHVSVHVRRGDYVQLSDMHPPVSRKYIKRAILHLYEKGYTHYTIYSDDIAWCKENITAALLLPEYEDIVFTYMDKTMGDEVKDALFDMGTMMQHEHNIISNSTFSYWAAMLNTNPNKIVVSPAATEWFGPAYRHLDTSNILPPEWVQCLGSTSFNMPEIKKEPEFEGFVCGLEELNGPRCKEHCGARECK